MNIKEIVVKGYVLHTLSFVILFLICNQTFGQGNVELGSSFGYVFIGYGDHDATKYQLSLEKGFEKATAIVASLYYIHASNMTGEAIDWYSKKYIFFGTDLRITPFKIAGNPFSLLAGPSIRNFNEQDVYALRIEGRPGNNGEIIYWQDIRKDEKRGYDVGITFGLCYRLKINNISIPISAKVGTFTKGFNYSDLSLGFMVPLKD